MQKPLERPAIEEPARHPDFCKGSVHQAIQVATPRSATEIAPAILVAGLKKIDSGVDTGNRRVYMFSQLKGAHCIHHLHPRSQLSEYSAGGTVIFHLLSMRFVGNMKKRTLQKLFTFQKCIERRKKLRQECPVGLRRRFRLTRPQQFFGSFSK